MFAKIDSLVIEPPIEFFELQRERALSHTFEFGEVEFGAVPETFGAIYLTIKWTCS